MPQPLSKVGEAARTHGISYACAKYRIENGIPLDAPVMTPLECGRNVQSIYQKKIVAERQARMVWQAEQAVRRAAREKLERERRQAAQRRRAEVEQRREAARITITAAPRREWRNPFAAMAVR
jgi:hypothetical protein